MLNKIQILLTKKKIKKYKKEIELLEEYDKCCDTCNTCQFFHKKEYWSYGRYTTIECLIDFKDIRYKENRNKCQFYKLHKKYRKITMGENK